ncbi:MAG: hypothetical protein WHS46_12510 [Desulfosoma sp.]
MRHLVLLFLFGVVMTGLAGCGSRVGAVVGDEVKVVEGGGPPPWAPAHGYRAKYRYHYYPDAAVYLDVGRGLYFYLQNGRWIVAAALPKGITIDPGRYVVLEMDADKPYVYHQDIVRKYPPGQTKKTGKPSGKTKW